MSTQSLPWFRMYTDFLMDPKMIALAFEDQRHFIGILALKSDGALDQDCCPDLMDRIVAQRLWIDHAIIRDVKKRLVAAELIDNDWQPLAWNKRQMRSDADPTNAERQRRHRERQKAAKEAEEKAVLEAKKKAQAEAEQSGKDAENDSNALRNAQVTPIDIDTDLDKEVDKKTLSSDSKKRSTYSESFNHFWSAYPNTSRRVAKGKCFDIWKRKNLETIADEVVEHVKAMAKTKQWKDGYEPAPLTYLNQDRWEDGLPDPQRTKVSPSGGSALYDQNMAAAEEAKRMLFGDGNATV